jgi:hypothetical protein
MDLFGGLRKLFWIEHSFIDELLEVLIQVIDFFKVY